MQEACGRPGVVSMGGEPQILREILDYKRGEIKEQRRRHPVSALKDYAEAQGAPRGFADRLESRAQRADSCAVIAEIKRASPSRGMLCENFDPIAIAQSYTNAGAACLSVLTDNRFFKGSGTILDIVRRHCWLPALRKDFIMDDYQIHQSRALGADCVLLIAAAVQGQQLADLFALAREYDMDVLVEVHDENELDRAFELGSDLRLIGVNNRDLHTFDVDLGVSLRLAPLVPEDKLVVSESGIKTSADIARLRAAGIRAFLIGEALMSAGDPEAELKALMA